MTIQRQVLDLLRSLQKRYGFACLFISHDLAVVESLADWIVVLNDGEVVEQGPMNDVIDRPRHPYTKRLLSAIPVLRVRDGGGYGLEKRAVNGDAGAVAPPRIHTRQRNLTPR